MHSLTIQDDSVLPATGAYIRTKVNRGDCSSFYNFNGLSMKAKCVRVLRFIMEYFSLGTYRQQLSSCLCIHLLWIHRYASSIKLCNHYSYFVHTVCWEQLSQWCTTPKEDYITLYVLYAV